MNMTDKKLFNKKAHAASDIFIFMVMGFAFMIAIVVIVFCATTMYTKLLENPDTFQKILPSGNATQLIQDTYGKVPNAYESLKWITVALILGMILSMIISAYLVKTQPIFFVAYLLIWIIAIIISVPLSNTYEEIYANPILTSTFAGFWSVNMIFTNLPVWITIIGGLMALLMITSMIKQGGTGYYG